MVWDAETGTLLFAVEKTGSERVACFAPDGKRIVVFSPGIRMLDATSGKELARFDGTDVWVENWRLRQAVLSPISRDGNKLLAYGKDGLGLLDVQTGKQLVALRGHSGALESALFSPDGRFVVTASDDQTARVWDAATGKEVHLLRHKAGVRFAVMTPDGRRVATASEDTVRVWDLELLPIAIRRKVRELSSHERERFGIK
jgi:WD40 repeat protein